MLSECNNCDGDGFVIRHCGCRGLSECPHQPGDHEPAPGIYGKFWVRRTDGTSHPGEKHHKCNFFVLDWDHDPFAIPAMRAYAKACEKTHPELAADIRKLIQMYGPKPTGSAPDRSKP